MTNLSPYRLGNTFVFQKTYCEFLYIKNGKVCCYFLDEGGIPNTFTDSEEAFMKEAVLKEITLDFLSELAREKGEIVTIEIYRNAKISICTLESDVENWYAQNEDETLGEFCLRTARARNYLS